MILNLNYISSKNKFGFESDYLVLLGTDDIDLLIKEVYIKISILVLSLGVLPGCLYPFFTVYYLYHKLKT